MGFNPFRALHLLAKVGRPLAALFRLKRGTVVDKGIDAAEILDPVLPRKDTDDRTDATQPPPR